jgi:hypothetical protein
MSEGVCKPTAHLLPEKGYTSLSMATWRLSGVRVGDRCLKLRVLNVYVHRKVECNVKCALIDTNVYVHRKVECNVKCTLIDTNCPNLCLICQYNLTMKNSKLFSDLLGFFM